MSKNNNEFRLGMGALVVLIVVLAFWVSQSDDPRQAALVDLGDVVAEPTSEPTPDLPGLEKWSATGSEDTETELQAHIRPLTEKAAEIEEQLAEVNSLVEQDIRYLLTNRDELAERVAVLEDKYRRTHQRMQSRRRLLGTAVVTKLAKVASFADGTVSFPPSRGAHSGLVAWRDSSYRTTRTELRSRFVHPDSVRVKGNYRCVEMVELRATQPEVIRFSARADKVGGGVIILLGRYPDNANSRPNDYQPREDMLRSSHIRWRYCD